MPALQDCARVDTKGHLDFRSHAATRSQSHNRINSNPAHWRKYRPAGLKRATCLVNQLALSDRPESFRRRASCSISLSRLRSATTLRSLLFSSSSCFSRRISRGSKPSYLRFQLKQVAWRKPAFRQISPTGHPVRAVLQNKRLLGVRKLRGLHRSPLLPSRGITAENSSQKRSRWRAQITSGTDIPGAKDPWAPPPQPMPRRSTMMIDPNELQSAT